MNHAAPIEMQRELVEPSATMRATAPARSTVAPRHPRPGPASGGALAARARQGAASERCSEPFLPGAIVDRRYRLREVIATGGMGTLWLAQDLTLESPVAIKVLRSDPRRAPLPAALLREARITASLSNDHIVKVHAFGLDRGRAYLALEYLDGEPLSTRLQRHKRLDLGATARIIGDLACALEHAHEANVVHLDLKPENAYIVMSGNAETVKLLDFGVALTPREPWGDPMSPLLLGTPLYMSPEQACCSASIDHRSDVWSLGVLAFECLVGRPPFWGDTLYAVLTTICSGRRPQPSDQGCTVSGFDAWFALACAHDPGARFGSAREAHAALEGLL